MRFGFPDRLRVDDRGRFFRLGGIDQQRDAGDDEGDGEDLAHVQEHRLLELHLRLLDEFDQEAHAEAAEQEEAEDRTVGRRKLHRAEAR